MNAESFQNSSGIVRVTSLEGGGHKRPWQREGGVEDVVEARRGVKRVWQGLGGPKECKAWRITTELNRGRVI